MVAKLPGNGAAQLSQGAASDAKLLEVGQHVCSELRNHMPPAQVEKELEGAWTRSNALILLGAASGQFSSLCPDQYNTVQAYTQSL
jgi:hypothetical protein